jgi:hypothetical protein
MGWWAIPEELLLLMLERAAAGESPDVILAEEYANAEKVEQ